MKASEYKDAKETYQRACRDYEHAKAELALARDQHMKAQAAVRVSTGKHSAAPRHVILEVQAAKARFMLARVKRAQMRSAYIEARDRRPAPKSLDLNPQG